MEYMLSLLYGIYREYLLVSWRDIVEIVFFIVIVYRVIVWLQQDTQKNLVLPFYGFCATAFTAYALNLSSISFMIFMFSPVIALLFIIMHERTLQKNFVSLHLATAPKATTGEHSVEILVQACLKGLNKRQAIIGVIQKNDRIDSFFPTASPLNAPISSEMIDLLLQGSTESPTVLVANSQGSIISLNPSQRLVRQSLHYKTDNNNDQWLEQWITESVAITKKCDVLVFAVTATTRLFDVIYAGKYYDNVPATQALSLIRTHLELAQSGSSSLPQGALYEHGTHRPSDKQKYS